MSLVTEYRRILDEAFSKHFSGWETLSPLDPLKVLSEAMTGSLGEIEKRQRRYVSALMDSLPTLCGFSPKGAELPVTLVSFQPVPRLTESRQYPAQTAFRFQKEEASCHALAVSEFRVIPLFDLTSQSKGTTVQLDFRYQGVASELTLQFVPAAQPTPTVLSQARVEILHAGQVTKAFSPSDLSVKDETTGFCRFGNLTIRSQEARALLFDEATQNVRLTLTFDRHLPQGELTANTTACKLAQVVESFALGFLTGEPWEEVFLPENVAAAPEECFLSFADDKTLTLTKQETSLLDRKHSNYDAFRGSFFYNGANHSLIVPAADELVGTYNGKVQLCARRATLRPPFETLSSEFQGRAGDYSTVMEKIVVSKSLSASLPRETKRSYLGRFYGAVSALQTKAVAVVNAHDLRNQLLSTEAELRAVEVQYEASDNHLTVFLLGANPQDSHSTQLSSDLLARVALRLSQMLPLTIRWQIQPFKRVPLTLSLLASAEVSATKPDVGQAQEALTATVKQWLQPPPFGQMHASTSYRTQDLAGSFSLKSLAGVVAKNGLITDSLVRKPGELLEADIKAQLTLQVGREVSHVA